MNYQRIIASFAILAACIVLPAQDRNFFEKGLNIHKIIIPTNATAVDSLAALKLQYFLDLRTGVDHPLVTEDKVRFEPYFSIGKTKQSDHIYQSFGADIKNDGFLIHTDKKNIYFIGNEGKSVLYSVYHFAEKYLDFRMYDADEITMVGIPGNIYNSVVPQIHDLHNPDFDYRETLYSFPNKSQEYADFHHLQNRADMKRDWGMFVHTFKKLIPVNIYYDQHPEWFSEIHGQRVKDGQLCLSNPEVLDELCKNLALEIEKNPSATIWSVSNNDNVNNCSCENCRRLDSIYGSPSGTLLHFINQVAERFPDKTISTLAYQFTRKAPKNIKPLPNVNIMFCSIECGRHLPLESNIMEKAFVDDLKNWSALTDNIFLWDYVIQFRNMMDPFPNLHVIQPNLQLFHNNGISMIFEQGLGSGYGEMMEWRTYLIAKLLWDVNIDVDSLRNDFLSGYYGKAAPYIANYIDLMQKSLLESKMFLNIYGYPIDAKNSYLSSENIKQYQSYFKSAYSSIEDQPHLKDHVRRLELSLDFAVLDLAMSNISEDLSYFEDINGKRYLRPEMMIKANKFVVDCKRLGVKQLEEMGYPPDEFMSNITNYIEKSTQHNIAAGKKVVVSTKWSEKYDVGGPSALTDGNFGGKDFHYNWLGFEGEHLDAVVDLDKEQSFNNICVDFLVYPLAWIYLPEKVEFFISNDRNTWEKVYETSFVNEEKLTKNVIMKAKMEKREKLTARYIRVVAKSILTNPSWHRGYGQPCWIFTDEILVQ